MIRNRLSGYALTVTGSLIGDRVVPTALHFKVVGNLCWPEGSNLTLLQLNSVVDVVT